MNETDMTLRRLFSLPGNTLPAAARTTVQANHLIPALKEALAKQSRMIKWDAVSDIIAEKTVEMLDVPVLHILVSAWQKYREVEEFGDPEKYPPADTQLVPLAEHTVKSEHRPYLEVLFKGVPVSTIEFTLTVLFTLEGFVLQIQGGRIKAIRTGALKGHGSLALESSVVMEKNFGTIQLPGTLNLGEGIPLRPSDMPRTSAATAG